VRIGNSFFDGQLESETNMKKILALTTLLVSTFAFAQNPVPPTFWGIMFNHINDTYPAPGNPVPLFYQIRLSDTGTSWGDIQGNNQAKGCNNDSTLYFSYLDNYLNHYALPNDFDVTYVAAQTPCFISTFPTDSSCAHFTGACDPPSDITCTGTGPGNTGGSDATFINFVQQLWTHMMKQKYYPGRHWFFEMWNEPNVGKFWNNDWINNHYCGGDQTATRRIMIRMAADARTAISAIDPNVLFITPAVSVAMTQAKKGGWFYDYLALGGGQYADIMGVHSYIYALSQPVEDVCCGPSTLIGGALATMAKNGQSSKPLWSTEGSCGQWCPGLPDMVGWTARYYTLLLSKSLVDRFNWYCYDIFGTLWNGKSLTPTGQMLGVIQSDWGYAGGTFSGCTATKKSSCAGAGHIYTCDLSEGGTGATAQVAWYDSQGNTCSYTPTGTGWIDYNDLTNNKTDYTGGPVTLGTSPILFEQSPPTHYRSDLR
jgi:hypothetical protein